jgi:hypothetical protein
MTTFHSGNPTSISRLVLGIVFLGLLLPLVAMAGELNAPPAPTDAGSAMFSIEAIYQRLLNGAAGTKRGGTFSEPAGPPASTTPTLNDIMGVAPAVDPVNGARADQVVNGKTFWGLTSGEWGRRTGTMPVISPATIVPGAATQTIPAGYHDGTGKVGGDANLKSENIKAGTSIFGVSGNPAVVDTSTGNATPGAILAGSQAWVNGVLVRGTRYAGVSCPDPDPARWSPNRRFYDNQDGTITDTTTGLIWLKYGSIGKFFYRASFPNYPAKVEVLKVYNGFYELTDGSIGGEWRLPSRRELDHLTHGVDAVRATSPQLFSSFPSGKIWTETIGTMNVELYVVDGTSGAFFLLEDNEQADVIPVRNPRP